jgi:hypothetical protein
MTRAYVLVIAVGVKPFPAGAALAGLLGLASCVGTIADGQSSPVTGPGTGGGPGDPGPSVKPPPPPVTTPGVEAVACRDFSTGPVFHRLNRTEWENSVNALLGTQQALRDQVGDDDNLVDGFDNSADVGIDQTLMLKHLGAAQKAVDTALADPAAAARLVPCNLNTANADCVTRAVETFLPRAFRRPVQPAEVAEYANYASICKSSPRAGVSCALQAVLVSPKFMYRAEFLGPEATDQACGVSDPLISATRTDLSPHAFAARLSYFITSSGPDAELLDLAAKGRLNDPAVIDQQVQRLLSAEQSGRYLRPFIESLPTQWLQVDRVKTAAPSPTIYPGWDAALAEAMQAESKLYFAEIVRENRSALDLIRSNFSFVNERLARHYGLTGVTGSQMRKVDTTGTPRGGIMTQASFLTALSSPENTSIVHRAKWVLTNLLCEHVTDPPDGVDTTVLPEGAAGMTNRESLDLRTKNPPCSACHEPMNPIGYGLEVFDAIGGLRSTQNNKPIDPSGDLPGAGHFNNADELMELLKKDERVPACLIRKMLTYALGRSLEARCDNEAMKVLVDAFKKDDFRLKNHIVRIAQSELFRTAQRR